MASLLPFDKKSTCSAQVTSRHPNISRRSSSSPLVPLSHSLSGAIPVQSAPWQPAPSAPTPIPTAHVKIPDHPLRHPHSLKTTSTPMVSPTATSNAVASVNRPANVSAWTSQRTSSPSSIRTVACAKPLADAYATRHNSRSPHKRSLSC